MFKSVSARAAAVALMLAGLPVYSAAAADEPAPIEERIGKLKAGQFVWQPERSEEGPVEIVISLGQQRAYVYRGGELIGASTISSGRKGYDSPIGRFQILEKKRMHRSNRYDDAPMPFMQRLNWFGIALHAGEIPNYPASHGCIRLPTKFARELFGVTERGGFVFITEDEPETPEAALELARAHVNQPLVRGREFRSAVGS